MLITPEKEEAMLVYTGWQKEKKNVNNVHMGYCKVKSSIPTRIKPSRRRFLVI
ncbi:hypothetical protein DPMN_106485 [Dreissena polymorpha]|uniref:Uncharacterized protein n=1 Tax=Dreissena polymorpha TaxID=45954 RepID=A0A9D4K522_DREPO|nr:hypothetical protein DPMN_106485 [Dreissena polymorpha]